MNKQSLLFNESHELINIPSRRLAHAPQTRLQMVQLPLQDDLRAGLRRLRNHVVHILWPELGIWPRATRLDGSGHFDCFLRAVLRSAQPRSIGDLLGTDGL